MPTVGDFVPDTNQFVPDAPADEQPDIVKHDPNTFAGLTAQNALKTLYAQGLQPTGDDIKGIYSKALDSANDFHKSIAQEQERANLELANRQRAITSGTLAAEKTTESSIQQAAQEQQEQFRQGPTAVALAKQQGNTGLVSKLGDTDLQRLDGLSSAYDTTKNLHGYFNNMIQNAPGSGGVLKSGVLGLLTQPGMTSPQTRAFNSYLEGSIVPLGRGVFGDAAIAATKPNIQEQMRDMLPNASDNDASGGQKIFMLKDRIMQNLQALRDDRANAGFDTTPIDRKIAEFNGDFRSSATQQYNPLANQSPVVATGTSPQANATINNVINAGANAGVNVPNSNQTPNFNASNSPSYVQPQASTAAQQPAQNAQQPQIPVQQFQISGAD